MKCLVIAAALLVVTASGACAASVGAGGYENQLSGGVDTRIDRDGGDFRGVFAGGIGAANTFVGSNDIEAVGLPLIDIEWRGAYFLSTQRGLGLNILRRRNLRVGPRLTIDQGRDAGDDSFLLGMSDIDPTIEGGVFLLGFGGPWRIQADLRRGFGRGRPAGTKGSSRPSIWPMARVLTSARASSSAAASIGPTKPTPTDSLALQPQKRRPPGPSSQDRRGSWILVVT